MKKNTAQISLLFLVFLSLVIPVQGQDLFLSISGKSAEFRSGDSRNQYDIWIKPEADARKAILQVYDAGINGDIDQITTTNANTTTTFLVYKFNDLYSINNGQLVKKNEAATAIDTLRAKDEDVFKKRWEELSEITTDSENGFIVRVTTDAGSDVNNFSLRVINTTGIQQNNNSWKVIAIDLGIGFFDMKSNRSVQIKPYNPGRELPQLVTSGEEDSRIEIIDAFGITTQLDSTSGKTIEDQFGIENEWALSISGSEEILNNITIYGKDQPQLWLFESAFTETRKPDFEVETTTANNCTDKSFRLVGNYPQQQLRNTEWRLDGSILATGATPTLSFSARGNQTLNVLIPNLSSTALPKYWLKQTQINITTRPVARLETPKEIIAPDEVITLSALNSYDINGQGLSYTWFLDGRPIGSGSTYDFSSSESGTYIVSVRVNNAGSVSACNSSQRQVRIRVNTQPYAEIKYDSLFQTGQYLTFSAVNLSDEDNDELSFEWDGLGVVSNDNTAEEVLVSHVATGTFEVSLTVNDNTDTQNSTYTVTRSYSVTPPEAKPIQQPIAADSSITDSTLSNPDTESINTGSNAIGAPPVVAPPAFTPQSAINAPRLSSASKVAFALDDSLLTSTDTSDTVYEWDFGDGNSATGVKPDHLYSTPGTYAVNVTIKKGDEIQRKRHVIVINEYPVATFNVDDTLAAGHSFRVDGSQSTDKDGFITNYQWFIDGVPAATGPTPSLTVEEPGIHTISLRVEDNSGHENAQDLSSKDVWVNYPPVPKWSISPTKIAPGDEVTLNASRSFDPDGQVTDLIWTFDDGTELRGTEITRTFEESGPHYLTLTAIDNQGLANSYVTEEVTVNVNHEPYIITETVVRSNSLEVKLDASETYDVDNDQVFFEWTLPDGSKRNEASFSWRAPEFGVHIVGLNVRDGLGLKNSANQETIRILINRPVEAIVDSLIATCSGQTVLFNSSSSYDPDGNNFDVKWYFGNGETSKEANPSYVYDAPGIYEARLELNDGISKETTVAKIPIIVEGSPVAKMNVSDTTICVNTAINFDGSNSRDPSGALPSLSWSLGDGSSESGPKIQHVYTEAGIYPVSLTVEGSGSPKCGNTNQVRATVRVIEGPNAAFDLQEWATPRDILSLDGSASSSEDEITYAEWRIEYVPDGSLETVEGVTANYQFEKPGEYLVTLFLRTSSSSSCNSVSLTKSLKVNAPPEINWTLPESVPAGSDLNLNALLSKDPDGFIKEFRWYMDGELISRNASEIIKTVEPGNHTVTLIVKDNSPSENNQIQMEKSFFSNSSPQPEITAPGKIYLNREVTLSGGSDTDRDGDQLTRLWKVNNQPLEAATFTPTELKKYRVTLVQDDGRGISNSVDSASVDIIPIGHPEINPVYPSQLSLGGSISLSSLGIPNQEDWKFFIDDQYQTTWMAESPGQTELTLTWFFEELPTSTVTFPITVSEPLQFVSDADTVRNAEWNPANPYTVIRAPEVNRDISRVKFTWFKDDQEIGSGYRINLPVQQGENRFRVQVMDLQVKQSSPVETELVVITE